MALTSKKVSTADSLATIARIALTSFIIAILYFGRELLVPLALAALLTFMLAPVVTWLQRWIGKIAAVIFVAITLVGITGATGWILTSQAVDLANKLPDYKNNIQLKLRSLKVPQSDRMEAISKTIKELKKDLPGENGSLLDQGGVFKKPGATLVTVVDSPDSGLKFVQEILAPVLGPLGNAALVLLMLIFMLLQREDLQNRLIRLIGQGRIGATTRAMVDAGNRVSKYLRMQLIVNVTYGIPVAVGLYFIGVPNAILWGALATVLRFIPYIGPWIAASFPLLISLAIAPDWIAPVATIGLFVVLELFSNNVMEPWLYGSSTGVSPIALIFAALVWAFLWGPVGLVLATPLTVCLVVMGRHIPRLEFLSILLSNQEPLTPAQECYYRLHKSNEVEVMAVIDGYLKTNSQASLFNSVLVPVLTLAEDDYRENLLDLEQLDSIHQGVLEVLTEIEIRNQIGDLRTHPDESVRYKICFIPAKSRRDELSGEILTSLFRKFGYQLRSGSSKMVTGELVNWVTEESPDLVVISAVAPSLTVHARYLCLKLRNLHPELRIVVGIWGETSVPSESIASLREAGANEIYTQVEDLETSVSKHLPTPEGDLVEPTMEQFAPSALTS